MANTYTLIQAQTLASTAASVTFSSIPATYTDLVLRISARSDATSGLGIGNMYLTLNGTATGYGGTYVAGDGATATSSRFSSGTQANGMFIDGSTATANTFANHEIYIPNYSLTQSRAISAFGAQENNVTGAYIRTHAFSLSSTTIVSSLALTGNANFIAGSSFYLYGISNS